MKLEVGKYYKTRDGRKAEIIEYDGSAMPFLVRHHDGTMWHFIDGKLHEDDIEDELDLIAEWQDEPEVYSEIIDKVNIAEAAFNSMVDHAEEDGRKVFIAEMEKALQDDLRRSSRAHILDTAKQYVTQDRQNAHGKPEDTFGLIAQLWGAYLGRAISPVEVCAMMALLKIARIKMNPKHIDSYVDLCGYGACAGELASKGDG